MQFQQIVWVFLFKPARPGNAEAAGLYTRGARDGFAETESSAK
ncbi:MAG: hypothetical protein PF483_06520 [Halothiobacillus sp.]|jgi:hypothetical protein|nr:hypothetical protein [Halothiobacillus sp.]